MQKNILVLLGLILSAAYMQGQLVNDSFSFRDDMTIDYNLLVKANDIGGNALRIIGINKLGANATTYTVNVSADSNVININSTVDTLTSGSFYYKTINSLGVVDSALVYFQKKSITADIYPGDCNKDNLVNHFDLFAIGLMNGKYGNPRHLLDTNLNFSIPKKVENWQFDVRGINAKHADVDGNGLIDSNDIKSLTRNFGLARGNYSPILSFASNDVKLEFSIADTIVVNGTSNKLSVPIVIRSPSKINAYGIGYSYTVRIYDPSTVAQSRYYPHTTYNRTNIWDEFSTYFTLDSTSYNEHTNVAYCRRNLSNGEMDEQAGVVDVIIEDVLLGIANPGETTYLNLYLKEVALIDNNYTSIPISPVSKRLYIQKAKSSIANVSKDLIKIYPTATHRELTIENNYKKSITLMGYDVLGHLVFTKEIRVGEEKMNIGELPMGIYYIRNNLNSEVIKIQRN